MTKAVLILLMFTALVSCVPKNQGADVFDRRAKCDELVRSKFNVMETASNRFIYPATSMFVTSNYTKRGECYGLIERNSKGGFIRILIDGVSGRDLAQYVRSGDLIFSGRVSENGEWVDNKSDADLLVSQFISQKMNEK